MKAKAIWDARIGACAAILRADRAQKVAQIAQNRGISEDEAARMYVVGALKASVRRGTARTLGEALDRFEADQVGDRSVSVQGEAPIVAEVRRINAANGKDYIEIRPDGTRVAMVEPDTKATVSHARNMGRVLGTLYVEWVGAEAATAPDVILELADRDAMALCIEGTIRAYVEDYVTRLSRTARKTIRDLVASTLTDSEIMSGKTEEAAKLKERAKYLHHNFPARDDITARELVGLLRKYAA